MSKRGKSAKLGRRESSAAFDQAVGARIRIRRREKEMTLAHVGMKVGCSSSQMARYEQGVNSTEPAMLARLADLFGCKASDLIDGIAL